MSNLLDYYTLLLNRSINKRSKLPIWKEWGTLVKARSKLRALVLVEDADVASITDLIQQYDTVLTKENHGKSSIINKWNVLGSKY